MARLLRTRRTWLIALALLAATTGVIVSLLVLARPSDVAFTATLYSDVIRFEADGVASLRVTIYDLAEKELWSSGEVFSGFVDWDRTNGRGERLANGYYLYLAQGWDSDDRLVLNKTGKVVLLPEDQVQLKATPPVPSPAIRDGDGSEFSGDPVMGPMAVIGSLSDTGIFSEVGIGTDSPSRPLHVTSPSGNLQMMLQGSGGVHVEQQFYDSATLAGRLLYAGGNVPAARYFGFISYTDQYGTLLPVRFFTPRNATEHNEMLYLGAGVSPVTAFRTGNVGIGTMLAPDKLTIECGSGNAIAVYPDGSRAAAAAVFRVESDGDVYADGTVYSSTTSVGSADVAERINASEWVEAGDVVEIDPDHAGFFQKASEAYSRRVAGIISTSPGVILGNDVDPTSDKWNDNRPVLAIAGRVPVKASAENGPIAVGDLLVSSSVPGVAMKGDPANSIGAVVGKAMGSLDSGEGVIMAQVTLR